MTGINMSDLQSIEYEHAGVALRGELAVPAGPGPHPGLLVMHDARGIGPLVRRRCQELAAAGYVAFGTDMYGGGRRFQNARDAGDTFRILQENPQLLRDRVLAGFEVLKAQKTTNVKRIGALGFCFGGQCVLELARSGADVKAVISFHGLLRTQLPAKPGAVKAKVLALTGMLDPYAPAEDVQAFQKEMGEAGVDWHLTIYGQGWHAFTDPDAVEMSNVPGVKYDSLLEKLSWDQATAFIGALV
jgi:dienelactone hydrolase